jgi:Domain of unknown function (DUF1906)
MRTYSGIDAYDLQAIIANRAAINAAGYTHLGAYIFGESGFKQLLTKPIAQRLSENFKIWTIFENGEPTTQEYFAEPGKGGSDAHIAYARTVETGQPSGSSMCYTIDTDGSPFLSDALTYAEDFWTTFRHLDGGEYKIGAYGGGTVLQALLDAGFIDVAYLSESRGFPGWLPMSLKAAIVQTGTTTIDGIDVDTDILTDDAGFWSL